MLLKKNIENKTIINSSFDIIYQLYMHIKLFWKNFSVSSFVKHNPDLKRIWAFHAKLFGRNIKGQLFFTWLKTNSTLKTFPECLNCIIYLTICNVLPPPNHHIIYLSKHICKAVIPLWCYESMSCQGIRKYCTESKNIIIMDKSFQWQFTINMSFNQMKDEFANYH